MLRPRPLPFLVFVFLTSSIAHASAQTQAVTPVTATALQKMLPAVDGWTIGVTRSDQVVLSPDAKYSYASVTLTKNDSRVKVQLSDTGMSADSLTALAMVVMAMPDDYAADVSGAAIKRTKLGESPAAEMWEAAKNAGEITAVVAGRFVVSVESSKIDSLDVLRSIFAKVDLKALAALK